MHSEHLQEHFGYLNPSKETTVKKSQADSQQLHHLALAAGIKPEFLNFKAHDYDNNDRVDGLELLAVILNEKVHHHHGDVGGQHHLQQQQRFPSTIDRNEMVVQMQLASGKQLKIMLTFIINSFDNVIQYAELVDRLLQDEDRNLDGYLDFTEYSNARSRLMTVASKAG